MNKTDVIRVLNLLKVNTFCVDHGIAYFNQNLSKKNIWVSFKVNMEDGFYTIDKNYFKEKEIYLLKCDYDLEVFKAPVCKSTVFVTDVKGIPYSIIKFVGSDHFRKNLRYLNLDAEHNSIVVSNNVELHKSDITGGVNSSLFIDPVVWDLMHYFELTRIERTDTHMVIKKDDVTITSVLPEKLELISFDKVIPEQNKPYIPFTTDLKERIIKIIRTFESYGKIPSIYVQGSIGIVFHGTYMKTVLADGRSFQMDLGVELFPDRIMSFDLEHIKLFLDVCDAGMLNHIVDVDGLTPVVITGENGSIYIIMPYYLKKDYYRSLDNCWISLDVHGSYQIG